MQQANTKETLFKQVVGEIIKDYRKNSTSYSVNFVGRAYGFDRGNLSKMENGLVGISLFTAWKLCEALNIKFSDFAKILEEKLGNDFKFFDE